MPTLMENMYNYFGGQPGETVWAAADRFFKNPNCIYTVTTTGTGAKYVVTMPGVTGLKDGMTLVVKFHTVSTVTVPRLAISNGSTVLGEYDIRRLISSGGDSGSINGYKASWLSPLRAYILVFDGGRWLVQGLTKPDWNDIEGVPEEFPPSGHTHDDILEAIGGIDKALDAIIGGGAVWR